MCLYTPEFKNQNDYNIGLKKGDIENLSSLTLTFHGVFSKKLYSVIQKKWGVVDKKS